MERGVCEFLENLQVIFNTSTILKQENHPFFYQQHENHPEPLKTYIDILPSLIPLPDF